MHPLPRKFEFIIALMDSSTFEHERITARETATEIARTHGLSLEEALRLIPRAKPRDLPFTRAEAQAAEMAERAARAREEVRQSERRKRLEPLIRIYGSIEAALEPCWRERQLLDAVARWRVVQPAPNHRWTMSVDGASRMERTPSDRVRRAPVAAYPLPKTFADAKMEFDYWRSRDGELGQILSEPGALTDDTYLDLVAWMRYDIVSSLVLHRLAVRDLQELEQRVSAIVEADSCPNSEEWDRVYHDIAALAARERECPPGEPTLGVADRVRLEVRRNAGRSDREIARIVRCSPTTVGRVRRQIQAATSQPDVV